MKAIVQEKYGSPDVLQLGEVEKPAPGEHEVLIRIQATAATTAHTAMREGPLSARPMTGLRAPKNRTPGTDLAGEIVATGPNVTRFKVGDPVFGSTALGFGTYAEYICLPEDDVLALKPANMNYVEATAIVEGALTALPFLRDLGHIQRGQKVLINGASGSIGTAAVQLAKHFGAEVTGVCSTRNLDLVRSLGADHVIDYTREDIGHHGERYDIIFDTVGKLSYWRCRQSLVENGIFLSPVLGLPILLPMLWTSIGGSKKAKLTLTGMRSREDKASDLNFIRGLIEAGELKAVVDRCYPLEETAEAHRYVESGHKRGNVVLTLVENGR